MFLLMILLFINSADRDLLQDLNSVYSGQITGNFVSVTEAPHSSEPQKAHSTGEFVVVA